MDSRKLPEGTKLIEYLSGFLALESEKNKPVDYGYHKNHLPKTSGNARNIASSFDLAKDS